MSGLRWSVAGKFTTQVFSWASTLIVIRILTPEDYGLIAISMVIVKFGMMVTELGLGSAIVYSDDIDDHRLRQVFTLSASICTLLYLLIWAGADHAAIWYDNALLSVVIPIQSLQLLLSIALIIPAALMAKAMRFKERTMVEMVTAFSGTAATLVLALWGAGVWALVYGHLIAYTVRVFLFNLFHRGFYLPTLDFSKFRAFGRYSFFNFVNRFLDFLYKKMDVLIIGRVLSIDVLGIYQVANNLAAMPLQKIGGVVNEVGLSAFSKVKKDPREVAYYFLSATTVACVISFPVFFGIAAVANELVPLVLGERWVESAIPLMILAMVVPVRVLLTVANILLDGIGRPEIGTRNLLTACVLIPTGIFLGISYGLVGVCIGLVCAYLVHFSLALRRVLPLIHVSVRRYLKVVMIPLLASITMLLVVRALGTFASLPNDVLLLASEVLLGVGWYLGAMMLFLDPRHRGLVLQMVRGRKKERVRGT
jgi:teichuronic acid exporter